MIHRILTAIAAVSIALAASAVKATALPTPAATTLSDDALRVAMHVHAARDAGGRPYAIVDKRAAALLVFHGDGSVAGHSTVLLGREVGDRSAPGVGERTQAGRLLPGDRTTPAGRYASRPGRNTAGEAVVWVDYDAAFAIHRLRSDASEGERARRLSSASVLDNRVSAGCVVVPESFFEGVVMPLLGSDRAVVYVIPEHGPWQSLWPNLDTAF